MFICVQKGPISINMYVCLAEVGANPEILRNVSYEICVAKAILDGMARGGTSPEKLGWKRDGIEGIPEGIIPARGKMAWTCSSQSTPWCRPWPGQI